MRRPAILSLICLCLVGLAEQTNAQQVTTLLQFTDVWKYDQSGLDLGTAWSANDFDDSNWSAGPGLLGFDNTVPYPYHLPIGTPLTISTTITSYFFRTTFDFNGSTEGLSLIAYALVDDGCAIYLNGQRVGGVRAPESFNATTYFPGHQGTVREDIIETVVFTNLSALIQGQNVLAAEVHQSFAASSDTIWGMQLLAIRSLPLTITQQPQNRKVMLGDTVNLEVEISGGPFFCQWQKNGVNIAGETSRILSLAMNAGATGADYRVIVTNVVSSLTSATATIEVFPDRRGLRLLSATARDIGQTNQILVTFDETIQSPTFPNSSSTNIANYRITRCGTSDEIFITNAVQGASQILLRVGGPNWIIGDCYYLTVKNVADRFGNRIAPDSQVPVAWPVPLELLATNAPWSFHVGASIDPAVFDQDWTLPGYAEGPTWARGNGVFRYDVPPGASSCLGSIQTPIIYQPEPSLFRTTFVWPAELGSSAQLRPSLNYDDGIILYLNGVEIWRANVPPSVSRLTALSRAASATASPTCVTDLAIAVTNLLPGLNWLAAGIVQSPTNNSDTMFGLRLSADGLRSELLPAVPPPTLHAGTESTNAVRLSWTGGGYALESTTNFTDNAASYPNGPWLQVTNMSNPYTNNLAAPTRFFRLKK